MIITTILKRIVDGLWAAGGIGAAAELGYEDFGSQLARPALAPCALPYSGVRGSCRQGAAQLPPLLEAELCLSPVSRKSVRG